MNIQNITVILLFFYSFVVEGKRRKKRIAKQSSTTNEIIEYIFLSLGVVVLCSALIFLLKKRNKLMRA